MMRSAVGRLVTAAMAAVALWALLVLLLVHGGLGARVKLHPDDPSQVRPLPSLDLTSAASPLEPVEAYAEVAQRPLFNPDRRPMPDAEVAPIEAPPPPPPPPPLTLVLTSVILTSDRQIALLQTPDGQSSKSVKLGANLEGDFADWKLVELKPRAAVFDGPAGQTSLDLRVFDGTGGAPPTPPPMPTAMPAAQAIVEDVGQGQGELAAPAEGEAAGEPSMTPEQRAEMIRQRIEERRRQMREEAQRAEKEQQ